MFSIGFFFTSVESRNSCCYSKAIIIVACTSVAHLIVLFVNSFYLVSSHPTLSHHTSSRLIYLFVLLCHLSHLFYESSTSRFHCHSSSLSLIPLFFRSFLTCLYLLFSFLSSTYPFTFHLTSLSSLFFFLIPSVFLVKIKMSPMILRY